MSDLKRTNIYLRPDQIEWMKEEDGSMAEIVRRAVDQNKRWGSLLRQLEELEPRHVGAALRALQQKKLTGPHWEDFSKMSQEALAFDKKLNSVERMLLELVKTTDG